MRIKLQPINRWYLYAKPPGRQLAHPINWKTGLIVQELKDATIFNDLERDRLEKIFLDDNKGISYDFRLVKEGQIK